MAIRFTDDKASPTPKLVMRARDQFNNTVDVPISGPIETLPLAELRSALDSAEKGLKRKRGRPVAPKPWIEAGVSRMTWHRRQKAKGELK